MAVLSFAEQHRVMAEATGDISPVPDLSDWIRPGDTIMWGQAMAEPLTLTRALVAQRHALGRVRVFVGIGMSDTLQPEHADVIEFIGYSAAGAHRALAEAGVLDILPVHYSTLPSLIASGALRVDALMLQVSPADEHGRHSLGFASEYLLAALEVARVVIAEVNPQVPWVHGERCLLAGDADLMVQAQVPPIAPPRAAPGQVEQAIGRHVATLIEDGATLQLGVGGVPDAVMASLHDRCGLGLHSGVATDGVAALAEAGVLTNARKTVDRGVSVMGLLIGGPRLRAWVHRNPAVQMRGTAYTHDPAVLARQDRLVAINSAIEVDLTGQVNAEVAQGSYMGSVGGAVDFLRAAARSRGGMPIVALAAMARGRSRIVANLSGPVSTARSDAGLIVTEHGVADMRGQPLSERVRRMVAIADPAQREGLLRAARELLRRSGARLL